MVDALSNRLQQPVAHSFVAHWGLLWASGQEMCSSAPLELRWWATARHRRWTLSSEAATGNEMWLALISVLSLWSQQETTREAGRSLLGMD